MNKKKKRIVAVIVVVCLALIATGIGLYAKNKADEERAEEERMEAFRELQFSYYMQSRAFSLPVGTSRTAKYETYDDKYANHLYRNLACYHKYTGNTLTIPEIEEYLSQEFEEDGSVRIYTSGRNPEIQTYVEWFWEHGAEAKREDYVDSLMDIFSAYKRENYFDKGLESPFPSFVDLTFTQYDELIKKEADPSYEMQFDFD